ncbi:hypothetical protein SDC9_190945 [bioreactor metagenome]|uniref:Uncharacterized protein n=1 Tax=bioreactor metagenome TaxID=1076179 RepID=A0A645HXQ3_9ZZZZ
MNDNIFNAVVIHEQIAAISDNKWFYAVVMTGFNDFFKA